MIENINRILTRRKTKAIEASKLVYKGKDCTSLLLRDVDSLTADERRFLRDYYARNGRSALKNLVVDYKIVPFAAHIFIALDCDAAFWQEKHDYFIQRNNEIKALLDSVFRMMETRSCTSVTLTENFAVVLASNLCVGCFCSSDVDLSADMIEKDKIVDCLKELNCLRKEQTKSVHEHFGQSTQFFNADIFEGGFSINVTWKPVTRAFLIQGRYEVRLAKDRLLAKLIPGTKIRVLNDTSLMYFCALHIAAGHYYTMEPSLRLYVDIDRLARACNINWESILKWQIEDDAGIRISMVLYLSAKLLKTPIPEEFYKNVLKNRRNISLVNYLYNSKTNQVQIKSNKLRRLYVELASDGKNMLSNCIYRGMQLIRSRLYD